MATESQITFNVGVDENHVPESLSWKASDNDESGDCKATMISIWDAKEANTLRIDLWTKDMDVEDMKLFTYQTMMTMADTFARATGEDQLADEMRFFANQMGEKMNLIKRQD